MAGTQDILPFTLSVLTENKAGLLNHITIIFTRRKINIDSLNVSVTEVPGVSRFTIVTHTSKEMIDKVIKQIRKLGRCAGCLCLRRQSNPLPGNSSI